jgi:hypothetical protein
MDDNGEQGVFHLDKLKASLMTELDQQRSMSPFGATLVGVVLVGGFLSGFFITAVAALILCYIFCPGFFGVYAVRDFRAKQSLASAIDALKSLAPSLSVQEYETAHRDIVYRYSRMYNVQVDNDDDDYDDDDD